MKYSVDKTVLFSGLTAAVLVVLRISFRYGNALLLISLFAAAALMYWLLFRHTAVSNFRFRSRAGFLVILLALLIRLSFFGSQPEALSDDVYRFVWDGKVQAAGINPYLYSPDSPALKFLRDSRIYPRINHKSYPTVYPPLAQFFFRLIWEAGQGSLLSLRIAYLLLDILIVLLLYRLLPDKRWLLLYLFSPLLIVETWGALHFDMICGGLLAATVYWFRRERDIPAALSLAAAVLFKYLALALLPVFFIAVFVRRLDRAGGRSALLHTAGAGCVAGAAIAAGFLPFLDAGGKIFSQLFLYMRYWTFNGFLHRLTGLFFGNALTRGILAVSLIAVLGILLWKRRRDLAGGLLYSTTAVLLFSAVLYPWYVLWLLPLLTLRRDRVLLLLSLTLFLSYWVLIGYHGTGVWREDWLVLLLQYLPPAGLALHFWHRKRNVQRETDSCDNSCPG